MRKPDSESKLSFNALSAAVLVVGVAALKVKPLPVPSSAAFSSVVAASSPGSSSVPGGVVDRGSAPSVEPESIDFTTLDPDTILGSQELLVAIQKCIRSSEAAICTNPDIDESLCIPTLQEGGFPVSIVVSGGGAPLLSVRVGMAAFDFPVDLSGLPQASEQANDICSQVRGWMLDPDSVLSTGGLCPSTYSEVACNTYIDSLRNAGSGGFAVQEASNLLKQNLATLSGFTIDERNATYYEFTGRRGPSEISGSIKAQRDVDNDAVYSLHFSVELPPDSSYSKDLICTELRQCLTCLDSLGADCD